MNNKSFKILGMMSGTSIDGIDMTIAYTNGIHLKILKIFISNITKMKKKI